MTTSGAGDLPLESVPNPGAGPAGLPFTIFTSTHPPRLTKEFGLDSDGNLTKKTSAQMISGHADHAVATDLHDLATRLDALSPAQAVAWGIAATGESHLRITTAAEEPDGDGAVARTRANFLFRKGPGIMMLDHDEAPDGPVDRDGFWQRLVDACPALAKAPMLWRPSSSAGLVAGDGRILTHLHRHRVYIPVADASAIPEAGERLVKLLWATGMGWFAVGTAGQALQRCVVDTSVWQPERLDFAAAPILHDGIQRPPVPPYIYNDGAPLFDLSQIVVTPHQEFTGANRKIEHRAAVEAQCQARRKSWVEARASSLAQRRGISADNARQVLTRAAGDSVLMGDFMLTASDGSQVCVADLLANAQQWHGRRFHDPLDPDDDDRVAVVNLHSGGPPNLYTHRHGGMRFELRRQFARIRVGRGQRVNATDAVLATLRDRAELFDFGDGTLAYVTGGRARPVTAEWLTDHMGRIGEYYSVGRNGEVPEDAPAAVAKAILAKHGQRDLRKLLAVVTAPTLRTDGSILDIPGHDESSGLLYVTDDPNPPRVPDSPTPAEALSALKVLWGPFLHFPLVDDVSRGVVLQALLTAVIRPSLPTAPGIALDAPSAGSGKTLLARCIGILATGTEPGILPPADDECEIRKRLFAELRQGSPVILWDNLRAPLGCAAIDAFLTADTFGDRILGVSETARLPNRALFVVTGNNVRMTGDTCRRVLSARLDAQCEKPYTRHFNFDPAQRVKAARMDLVVAALTIMRAYRVSDRPGRVGGATGSFEDWDALVRQTIRWLKSLVAEANDRDLPELDDPLAAAQRAFDQDPETAKHTALLRPWSAAFRDAPTTVSQAVREAEHNEELHAALEEIGGQGQRINTRIVGRWIERHLGQRIGGLRFERGNLSRGLSTWVVKRDRKETDESTSKPTTPTTPTTDGLPLQRSCARDGGYGGYGGFDLDNSRDFVRRCRDRRSADEDGAPRSTVDTQSPRPRRRLPLDLEEM